MTIQELRELDAWIAEHLFNWTPTYAIQKGDLYYRSGEHGYTSSLYEAGCYKKDKAESLLVKGENMRLVPHERPEYTTDPSAAMDVLKKCAEKKPIQIGMLEGKWGVSLCDSQHLTHMKTAETIELAICLFAKQLFSQTTK